MTIFVTAQIPVKTKEQKKISSLSIKINKQTRDRMKSGPCVTIYKKD